MGLLDLFRGSQEERLAKLYMAALRAVGISAPMRYAKDEDAIHVQVPGQSNPFKANLHNVRLELQRHPEAEHEQILRTFALGMVEGQSESSATYAEAKPRLIATVKDDTYIEFLSLLQAADGKPPKPGQVNRSFAPGILLVAAEDMPTSLRIVSTDHAAQWEVTADTVMNDAISNAQSLPASFRFVDGIWVLEQDDAYATSRLLNPSAFRDLQLKGSPVAIVPDRHTLAVTGADDLQGLEALARALDTCVKAGRRPISATPLVLSGDQWQEFHPPEALRRAFGNPRRLLRANFWMDYKDALEKHLTAKGEDIFVASLSVRESAASGDYESFAVWSKDVDTILPVADKIMFFEGEGLPLRRADWSAVYRVMSSAMERLPSMPERYRVRTYPTPEQFVGMGAELVERVKD